MVTSTLGRPDRPLDAAEDGVKPRLCGELPPPSAAEGNGRDQ